MFDKAKINDLMKQAQEMQQNLQKSQDEIAKWEVEGRAENGMVKVIMNCRHHVIKVSINPSIINNINRLELLFAAAVNDATKKVEVYTANQMMTSISSGMLDGLSGMKFPI